MLRIPVIYVRGKQAFSKKEGILRLLGKPTGVARDFAEEGRKLIHIIDKEARGTSPNFDVYDSLTTFMHIQVECGSETFAKLLVGIKARAVVRLPPKFSLEGFSDDERLLVGIIESGYSGSVEGVHDLIIENADDKSVEKFSKTKKRLIVKKEDYEKLKTENKKKIWGVLE
uniref:Uncharacterized protein n=1 Tax=Candidatus Methanophaga sp. ANME-1 ERB7 TaxID=2759913 RepID=A0A7G9Z2I5_9EURY|nr:hypothetical protein FMKGKFDM_00002 [Methanosarcinales archaeon ANME-1 ERB7]